MKQCEPFFLGRTFDDFLIKPQKSSIETRKNVDLSMPLSRNLKIKLPVIAANMDTITGAKMMRTMSIEGGFAFLHRNCSIADQAAMVAGVKKQHSYIIENPLVISADATMAEAIALIEKHQISGLLVEQHPGNEILVGILSRRDLEFARSYSSPQEKVRKIMKDANLIVAPPDIATQKAEKMMLSSRVEKLPLVDANNRIRGLITLRDLRLAKQKPYSSKDNKGRLLVGAAIGATGDFLERAQELIKADADCIVIDIAHAHSDVAEKAIKSFRHKFVDTELVVGNIATAEAAVFLERLGVDAVKVGIGPGRGCRTRIETGFGVPQLQAIRLVFGGVGGRLPIIADAGMYHDKDIFMAIACGASTVMSGGMFAGTDESPGDIIIDPATYQKFKMYRGMTSPEAVIANAPDDEVEARLSTPAEGQSQKIPYVGPIKSILERVRGHLQSAVSYAGETSLFEAHKKISADPEQFLIALSGASRKESFDR